MNKKCKISLYSVMFILVLIGVFFTCFVIADENQPQKVKEISDKEFNKNKYQKIHTDNVDFELPKYATHYWNPSSLDTYEVIINNFSIKNNSDYVLKFTWDDERYISESFQVHYNFKDKKLKKNDISFIPLEDYNRSCLMDLPDNKKAKDSCLKEKKSKLKFNQMEIEIGEIIGYEYKMEMNQSCLLQNSTKDKNKEMDDNVLMNMSFKNEDIYRECLLNVSYPIYYWNDWEDISVANLPNDFLAIDDVSVSVCGVLSIAGETYNLNASIVVNGSCFVIDSDNIILDLAGYNITGNGYGEGISIGNYDEGNTIKNGGIYNFNYGIHFYESDNNFLTNITANSNTNYGIRFYYSDNNILTNITANSNGDDGIPFYFSSNNNLTNINANSNGDDGIHLRVASSNNTLTNITANLNGDDGIHIYASSNNTLTNITANSNGDDGIQFNTNANNNFLTNINSNSNWYNGIYLSEYSNNNILTNITANLNYRGIYIYTISNSNTLTNITANSNDFNGIRIYYSDNNILTNITANSNYVGIQLYSSSNHNLTNITANFNTYGSVSYSNSNNNILTNLISNSDERYGITISGNSNNNIFQEITLINSAYDSITMWDSPNNKFINIYLNTVYDDDNDGVIYLSNSSNNIFQNGNLTTNQSWIINLSQISINSTFLNCSYDISKDYVEAGSELTRQWYLDVQVNDTVGSPIENTSTEVYYLNESLFTSTLTNSEGYSQVRVTEYTQNSTDKYYQTPHTINVSSNLHNYTTTIYNFSSLQNVQHSVTLEPDIIFPQVNISSPSNGSSFTGTSATIKYDVTDANLDSCYFTLRDSNGSIHNYVENTSIHCSGTKSIFVLDYGTYTFYLYGEDYASHINSSKVTFTLTIPPTSTGGGGSKVVKIDTISVILPKVFKTLKDVQRAIIYARIIAFIEDGLTFDEKNQIIENLKQDGIVLTLEELNILIYQIDKEQIENIKVSQSIADRYNLIRTVLVYEFQVVPRILSGEVHFVCAKVGGEIKQFRRPIKANKLFESCEVTQGNWRCEVSEDKLTAYVIYDFKEPDFFIQTLEGEIKYISHDGEVDYTRVISMNIINVCQEIGNTGILVIYPIILGVVVLGVGGFILYRKRKNYKGRFLKKGMAKLKKVFTK